MTKQQEAAIARVCAHECLQRELVEALEAILDIANEGEETRPAYSKLYECGTYARIALAKARGEAA